MSDEPTGAGSQGGSQAGATSGSSGSSAMQRLYIGPGASIEGNSISIFSPEGVALATATAIYSKAFLETLGQRTGEGVAKRVEDLMRIRKEGKKGKTVECMIGVDDGATAMILVTEDTPDEARLALLDLDVTAEEVRGKTLRWDVTASAWLADDEG